MGKMKAYYWISIVFYAFIVINLIGYVLLAEFIFKRGQPGPGLHLLRYIVLIDAILTLTFIGILKYFLLKKAQTNRPPSAYFWRLLLISIFSSVLCEPFGVYGLAAYIMGGSKMDIYLIWGVAALLMAYYFPSYRQWEKYIRSKISVK